LKNFSSDNLKSMSLAHEVFELDGKDGLEVAISKHLEKENEELFAGNCCSAE